MNEGIRVADAPSSRRINDHRRELYCILRCWQEQLALPRPIFRIMGRHVERLLARNP